VAQAPGDPGSREQLRAGTGGLTKELEGFFQRFFAAPVVEGKRQEEILPASIAVTEIVERAIELDDLKEAGATFLYPQALSIIEWLSIKILSRERRSAQSKPMPTKYGQSQQNMGETETERKQRLRKTMMCLPPIQI
jgi:hypothetical protein